MSAQQLQAELAELLRTGRRMTPEQLAGMPRAADGSARIPSMIAVWLLSQVSRALGVRRVVNLSKVRREDLRSLRGVAGLLHATLHPTPAAAGLSS
jgi:hypothetical protein